MSIRARYETKNGEHLTISRGTLRIRDGATGQTEERSISGAVSYDRKTRALSITTHDIMVNKTTGVRTVGNLTLLFDVTKDPGEIRAAARAHLVETEKGRLLGLVRTLPKTIGADPSGLGGSENPEYAEAMAALRALCKRHNLDFAKVMSVGSEQSASEKPKRKKAKERRAKEKEQSAS